MKNVIIALSLCAASFVTQAQYLDVICANEDGSKWEFMPTGQKIFAIYPKREIFRYKKKRVVAFKRKYDEMKQQCENYFPDLPYPQPSNGRFGDWMIFTVPMKGGYFKDMPGRYDLYDQRAYMHFGFFNPIEESGYKHLQKQ